MAVQQSVCQRTGEVEICSSSLERWFSWADCGALVTMLTAFLPLFLESIGFCSAGEECKMAAGEGGGWQCPQPF